MKYIVKLIQMSCTNKILSDPMFNIVLTEN